MAHWAEINEDNIVIQVLVGNNDDPNEGYDWLIENLGGTWIKTSYNTNAGVHDNGGIPLRKNFAAPGYTYDTDRDAFVPPQIFNSWTLNEETCLWDPPTPYPTDGEVYDWNEDTLSWDSVTE